MTVCKSLNSVFCLFVCISTGEFTYQKCPKSCFGTFRLREAAITIINQSINQSNLLGPFYGAIAVPSVTRCRCRCCCCCCGHRRAGGVRRDNSDTWWMVMRRAAARCGEWVQHFWNASRFQTQKQCTQQTYNAFRWYSKAYNTYSCPVLQCLVFWTLSLKIDTTHTQSRHSLQWHYTTDERDRKEDRRVHTDDDNFVTIWWTLAQ